MEEEIHCFHKRQVKLSSLTMLLTKYYNIKITKWKHNRKRVPWSLIFHTPRLLILPTNEERWWNVEISPGFFFKFSSKTQGQGEWWTMRGTYFVGQIMHTSYGMRGSIYTRGMMSTRCHTPLRPLKSCIWCCARRPFCPLSEFPANY